MNLLFINITGIKKKGTRTALKKVLSKALALVLAVAMLNLSSGCNYFKIASSPAPLNTDKITMVDDAGKTIIVHFGNNKWILEDLVIQNDSISGRLVEYKFTPTLNPLKYGKPNRFLIRAKDNQRYLLNEVHLYLTEYSNPGTNQIKFPVSSVRKIDIYDRDTAATAGTWFLAAAGAVAVSFLSLLILVAIFKESCPFIYTWDGEKYQFAGEIYSGTIHKPLERHDYLKLPVYLDQESYKLKITNEVREIQHTNLLELLVVDHPAECEVLVDKNGKVHSLTHPVIPARAVSLEGKDVTGLMSWKDDRFYQSIPTGKEIPLRDGIVMQFPIPEGSHQAKLAIRAKNSILLDYMLGEFNKLFGDSYHAFMKRQQRASAEKLFQWPMDQGMPLSVYVEKNGNWEFVDYFNIAGPMAFKEDVLEIPLHGIESDSLKVKLEYGYFFWEIDYTAISFQDNTMVTTYSIPVETAITEAGEDVTGFLRKDDGQYYIQPETNNYAEITFSLPVKNNEKRSVFLHSKGWYEILIDPQGKPDWKYIKAFREPGRFNRFVNEKFIQLGQLARQQ
jgi:hypothetical protein